MTKLDKAAAREALDVYFARIVLGGETLYVGPPGYWNNVVGVLGQNLVGRDDVSQIDYPSMAEVAPELHAAATGALAEIDRIEAELDAMGSQAIRDHVEYKARRNEQFAAYDKLYEEHKALKAERDADRIDATETARAAQERIAALEADLAEAHGKIDALNTKLEGCRIETAGASHALEASTEWLTAMQAELNKRERRIDEVATEAQDARARLATAQETIASLLATARDRNWLVEQLTRERDDARSEVDRLRETTAGGL